MLISFLKISTNGLIGLGKVYNGLSVREMNSDDISNLQIVCPFWTDLVSHQSDAGVFYQAYSRYVILFYDTLKYKIFNFVTERLSDTS